jgi:hypothetical protein
MKKSGRHWTVISEDEQDRQLTRMVGAVKFSEDFSDSALANAARTQYFVDHPEQPLFAFVVGECRTWLQDLARRRAESESDKYVMMAAISMVNCIAATAHPEPRG